MTKEVIIKKVLFHKGNKVKWLVIPANSSIQPGDYVRIEKLGYRHG